MTEKEMYNLINSQNGQSSNGFAVNDPGEGDTGTGPSWNNGDTEGTWK